MSFTSVSSSWGHPTVYFGELDSEGFNRLRNLELFVKKSLKLAQLAKFRFQKFVFEEILKHVIKPKT